MEEQKKQGHKGKEQKMYGITAERHSIKRDIADILALLNKDMDIDLDAHDIEDRALLGYEVEYDAAQHVYKVSRRPYDFEELRLLAECVRASKFITKNQEAHLLSAIEGLCSDYQIEELIGDHYNENGTITYKRIDDKFKTIKKIK